MISNEVKIQAGSVLGIAGLMTWLNCRPLGIIFFTILIAFSYKQLYPKARLQVPLEVQTNVKSLVENFAQLRKDKPGAFCVIISGGLVTVAIAGHFISGTWLLMGTLIGLLFFCAKHNVKVVHDNGESKQEVLIHDTGETRKSPPCTRITEYEIPDEFLPDVSDENISLLKQVAEDADISNYLYKTNTSNTTENDDKEDSDSEVPSDLLLTSDKIPEIEDEEVTFPSSSFSPMDSPIDIELPRTDIKVSYDPFSEDIEFKNQHINDDSSDSDDSISRGLNFQDVSLPDGSGSGPKGAMNTERSSEHERPASREFELPSKLSPLSSHQPQRLEPKNNSPTWNIVNNLWDAVNSSVVPSQSDKLLLEEPAVIIATNSGRTLHHPQKSVNADLSSDESDFELLDTEDLNINN